MTPEEAIQQLEFDRAMILFDSLTGEEITPEMLKLINKENYLTYVADGIAIEALKEIQQYREIGTVEECYEAVEKQKAERIEYETNAVFSNGFSHYRIGKCPICDNRYNSNDEIAYCSKCGQKLDWSEEDE